MLVQIHVLYEVSTDILNVLLSSDEFNGVNHDREIKLDVKEEDQPFFRRTVNPLQVDINLERLRRAV